MSLATAIRTGDVTELPSRRDEDWHWTDLRGLIREMPAASAPFSHSAIAVLWASTTARRTTGRSA